ncbi:hypothetical protein MFLO_03138 [Listeria floridensis FSL S10-1187]|uniref:Uncharacterized protein n=1 Tax=Listeria floridensis FSL S10-1187 TaxID=1265817 RepID=A0ABP3B0R0_9LIST|nr:DUF3116 family protein [Listeria floridensis]EUJ33504.1 hypothetical protein MFLO_03138 [Listeria floridensis FSL S10-1187]
MWRPTDEEQKMVLSFILDPEFVLINMQQDSFAHAKMTISKNEFLRVLYWLEQENFLIRLKNVPYNQKKYFLTDKGDLLYRKLSADE